MQAPGTASGHVSGGPRGSLVGMSSGNGSTGPLNFPPQFVAPQQYYNGSSISQGGAGFQQQQPQHQHHQQQQQQQQQHLNNSNNNFNFIPHNNVVGLPLQQPQPPPYQVNLQNPSDNGANHMLAQRRTSSQMQVGGSSTSAMYDPFQSNNTGSFNAGIMNPHSGSQGNVISMGMGSSATATGPGGMGVNNLNPGSSLDASALSSARLAAMTGMNGSMNMPTMSAPMGNNSSGHQQGYNAVGNVPGSSNSSLVNMMMAAGRRASLGNSSLQQSANSNNFVNGNMMMPMMMPGMSTSQPVPGSATTGGMMVGNEAGGNNNTVENMLSFLKQQQLSRADSDRGDFNLGNTQHSASSSQNMFMQQMLANFRNQMHQQPGVTNMGSGTNGNNSTSGLAMPPEMMHQFQQQRYQQQHNNAADTTSMSSVQISASNGISNDLDLSISNNHPDQHQQLHMQGYLNTSNNSGGSAASINPTLQSMQQQHPSAAYSQSTLNRQPSISPLPPNMTHRSSFSVGGDSNASQMLPQYQPNAASLISQGTIAGANVNLPLTHPSQENIINMGSMSQSQRGNGINNEMAGLPAQPVGSVLTSMSSAASNTNQRPETYLDGRFNGGWQSNSDMPDRRTVIFSILEVLKLMGSNQDALSKK
jgi:hypothetical protein